jgi:hypothetical protein
MDLGDLRGRGACGADSNDSGLGLAAGCCECGDEPLGSGTMEIDS